MNTELTIGELKRALVLCGDDLTLDEARAELAEIDRREVDDLAHGARVTAYDEYVSLRRQREHEHVQGTYVKTKEATLENGRQIDRDGLHAICAEAADLARLRYEVAAPELSFEEWVAKGEPRVYEIKGAKLAGASP